MEKTKIFVLDTNVLLYSAGSIESFTDNDVVIPMAVVEELDKFKKDLDQNGRNARQVIRKLDRLRIAGNLREGSPLQTVSSIATGKLRVLSSSALRAKLGDAELTQVFQSDLTDDSPDNRILQVAFLVQLLQKDHQVIFISKDINLRLKADALGLKVMDYEREKIRSDVLYTGFRTVELEESALKAIYRENRLPEPPAGLFPNEFVVYRNRDNSGQTALAREFPDGSFATLRSENRTFWNITARNREQRMALELLCDPAVQLVTLVGGAGTGKTLLALAAGLEAVLKQEQYEKILVSRPIVPLGKDLGYLPGDKGSKLLSWMQPIYDNLDFLLRAEGPAPKGKSRYSGGYSPESLINSHRLELEALTYIRGRSLPRQYVIIDEAQNLTAHEVKTIISRAGEGTKMVLTGDPHQIDNPYIDSSSNGLSYLVERFKGEKLFGHVTLARSERSPLSALAANLL